MTSVTTSSSTRLIAITSSSDSRCSAPNRSASAPSRWISVRWFARRMVTLDIEPAQHGGRRFVEQVGAAHVLEAAEQVVGAQALLLGAAEIVEHRAAVHHDEPIAEMGGLLHRVGHH